MPRVEKWVDKSAILKAIENSRAPHTSGLKAHGDQLGYLR